MSKISRQYKTKKECKRLILETVEKYFVQGDNGKIRYGQLKFTKGLIIRNLAASTRVRLGKTSFLRFVEESLFKDREEVISFFDCECNITEFMQSAYGNDILFQHNFREEIGCPPFLLLRRVQTIMEKSLVTYLNIISDENEEDLMDTSKKAAYVKLLYSVALYEIFVKEYLTEITESWENADEWFADKDKEYILNSIEEWSACKDSDEKRMLEAQIQPMVEAYLMNYDRLYFYIYFYVYSFRQLQNLLAVFRIIVLIEFVNYNSTHDVMRVRISEEEENELVTPKEKATLTQKEITRLITERKNIVVHKGKNIIRETEFWQFHVANWFKQDKDFFALVKRNPNFNSWYRELNKIIIENDLLKEVNSGRDEEYHHFRGCVQEYVNCVEKANAQKRTKEQEEHLWKIQQELSVPIWNVVRELQDMKSTRE